MQIPANTIYPRTGDRETVYLNAVVSDPNISVGDYTIYNDFLRDPTEFVRNNVLYHYPINGDRLVIGKFCSIACGAKFLFTSANHTLKSLSTYPFPIFYEAWDTSVSEITEAWDNRGDIVIGSDVWIGYEAVILSGVRIGDGAIVANQAVEALGRVAPWLALALLAFSLLCAFGYSRYITRPIVRLNGIAGRMAELDLQWVCGERRRDEIGQLGRSLDKMARRLSAALTDLETANQALGGEVAG